MRKIQYFELSSFQIPELSTYCSNIENFAQKYLIPNHHELCKDFLIALVELRTQWVNAAENHANDIDEADTATDLAWKAINAQLRININHYDSAVRDAAKEVLNVFSRTADPTRLPYAEEYAQLQNLLSELEKIPVEWRQTAMVAGWIDELQNRVTTFCSLLETDDTQEFETGTAKKARLALANAYRVLIDKTNVALATTADENIIEFSKKVNEFIDDYIMMQLIRQTMESEESQN